MTRPILWLFGALAAALSPAVGAAEPIRFAPLPLENREATVKAFNPLARHLERRLGQPVTLVYFDRYDDILAAFEQDRIDLVFLGSLPYLKLRQRTDAVEPLVRFKEPDGRAAYRCALIAFTDDPVRLANLKGRRVGLTQPLSTCGYLGANAMLRARAGIRLEETDYRYLGSHEKVALAVVGGEVDVGSVKEEFALKFAPLGLRVLAHSDWLPATGLFANRRVLGAERVETIRRVLLTTPSQVYQTWGGGIRHGMADARDADFDAVRRFGDPERIPAPRPLP